MGKVLEFSPKPPSKFGFERVRKRKKGAAKPGQMNLFGSPVGHILRMPTNAGPFEEALVLDERNDRRAEEAYLRAISEGDSVADAYCNLGILESKAGGLQRRSIRSPDRSSMTRDILNRTLISETCTLTRAICVSPECITKWPRKWIPHSPIFTSTSVWCTHSTRTTPQLLQLSPGTKNLPRPEKE